MSRAIVERRLRGLCVMALVLAGACADPTPSTAPSPSPSPSPSTSPSPSAEPCRPATAGELAAITLAESFVRDQGYTEVTPSDDVELTSESMEPAERSARLGFRHASLAPHAVGVFPHASDAEVVTVVFGYERSYLARVYPEAEVDDVLARTGRAVEVDRESVRRIVHQDALLSHVERVCLP